MLLLPHVVLYWAFLIVGGLAVSVGLFWLCVLLIRIWVYD